MPVSKDSRSTAAKKAVFLDSILRRQPMAAACSAAGVSRRLPYHWEKTDQEFAAAWAAAADDAQHLVSRRQVGDWRAALVQHEAELVAIEAALAECAAPAMAGDADAITRRDELRQRHQGAQEAIQGLQLAISSGEQHLERQAAERAERDRQAAQAEADGLAQQQRQAAARVDAALRDLESGWSAFVDLAGQRQSAARRGGINARAVYAAQLVQAVHVVAPAIAQALGIGGRAPRRGRPLSETVS